MLKIVRFVPGCSILPNKKTLCFVLNKTRTTYDLDIKIYTIRTVNDLHAAQMQKMVPLLVLKLYLKQG